MVNDVFAVLTILLALSILLAEVNHKLEKANVKKYYQFFG